MALYPRATKQLIPAGDNDPAIKPRIGILHVDGGNVYNLHDYFNGPSGGIESHFHIPKERVNGIDLFQYRDTDRQADANLDANDFAISFETQGLADEEWTEHQLDEIKLAMLWARKQHGIPLRVVTSWNDPVGGWGYHTLWGAPSHWTPVVKSCPGPNRKLQFHKILVPWMTSVTEGGLVLDEQTKKYFDQKFEVVNARFTALSDGLVTLRTIVRKQNQRTRDKLREKLKAEFELTEAQLESILDAVTDEV